MTLDPHLFEWGFFNISERNNHVDWGDAMDSLAHYRQYASAQCGQAAQDYLEGKTEFIENPLLHLFMRSYGGKKLILFFDGFDKVYSREGTGLVSRVLHEVQNLVRENALPSFQAVVFFGSYNATLIPNIGSSRFTYDSIHSEYLDFSLDETRELFRQYQVEYQVEVSDDVIKEIHRLTGGQAGRTNFCGFQMLASQKVDRANFDLPRWKDFFPEIVYRFASDQNFYNIREPLRVTPDLENTMRLLQRLCDSDAGIYFEPISENTFNDGPPGVLQQLGLAKMETRGDDSFLVIASEFMRMVSLFL